MHPFVCDAGHIPLKAATQPSQNQRYLKKAIAILLLLVIIWSQYVKQAVYLECRLANSFRSYAISCDCEKKAGIGKQDPVNTPLSQSHTHTHPDELFPCTCIIQNDVSVLLPLPIFFPIRHSELSDGCYGLPFQPPRQG